MRASVQVRKAGSAVTGPARQAGAPPIRGPAPPPENSGNTLRRLVIGLAKVRKGIAHCIARGVRNGHGCRLALRLRAGHLPRRPDDEAGHIQPEGAGGVDQRSEEHTSELQSLMRISYAVFCLKKKKQ